MEDSGVSFVGVFGLKQLCREKVIGALNPAQWVVKIGMAQIQDDILTFQPGGFKRCLRKEY